MLIPAAAATGAFATLAKGRKCEVGWIGRRASTKVVVKSGPKRSQMTLRLRLVMRILRIRSIAQTVY